MAWFRRRSPQVLRKSTDSLSEERKVLEVGGSKVEVRRVEEATTPAPQPKQKSKRKATPPRGRSKGRAQQSGRSATRQKPEEEIILPPETARKQMLIRVTESQTQIVVTEGAILVEHYVTRPDTTSSVGNIYLAKVRNVLPGMEAAFLDFGADKNGVLYVSDLEQNGDGRRHAKIEETLKEGDEVLVQVVKDAMGSKGARLTGTPSLAGRYLVLVPNSNSEGISRRLPDAERTRLRDVIKSVRPPGFGVIVRTAALHATAEEIAADISRLEKSWTKIQEEAKGGGAPRIIHREPDLLIRTVREHFTGEFRRLLIDDPKAHDLVVDYLRSTAPDLVSKVKLYEDEEMGIFERYHIDDQLKKALERKVFLPSGGHLVIDRTEALTVVDVNTGRFVGSSNLEETVLQNNMEAAEEIGRQLRLRDIGGIIVIDFIDMERLSNQNQVLRKLKETLAKDKTRTQVFSVSALGLVEMTRKNVSAGLIEHFSERCEACEGRGLILRDQALLSDSDDEIEEILDNVG